MVGSFSKEHLGHFVGSTITPTQKFTSASSPQFNGVAEQALGSMEAAASAARIQAPILFPNVELPSSDYLWTEAMPWTCHTFYCSATTSNPHSKSPREMWHGSPPRRHLLPFFKPGYHKAKRTNKSQPKAQECFYLGPGRSHTRAAETVILRECTSDSRRESCSNGSTARDRDSVFTYFPPTSI